MEQQIGFGGNVERFTTMTAELIEAFFDRIVRHNWRAEYSLQSSGVVWRF